MPERIAAALAVTVPVFLLVALGWYLRRREVFSEPARRFATGLVYHASLPALIISGIAGAPIGELFVVPVLAATLGATVLVALAMAGVALLCRLPRRLFLPVVAAGFWGNVAYLGFPIADQAWPEGGLAVAGIVNAFAMPTFVIFGTILLGYGRPSVAGEGQWRRLRPALCNPIILAALVGLAIAALAEIEALRQLPERSLVIGTLLAVLRNLLQMFGALGLALALLCVGASLEVGRLRSDWRALLLAAGGKLLLAPLLAWSIFALAFPGSHGAERGVAVVLMGMPMSVGAWVIAAQLGLAAEFIGSLLVVTTAAALLTTTAWLAVVL